MKRILLIVCIFTLLLSCNDDEKAAPDLTVNPAFIEFENAGATEKVYINSNTSWASSSDQEWCRASVTRKFGNDTVEIIVEENIGIEERIAYVRFYNPEETIIVTVKVIQNPAIRNDE
ncbi:MAG: BACON domain-containing protein [Prevotellaceae bacterium]|jgi:hypothetical protein|nr:BACON domain-containing protein [Prevotellaceae bacterium]